MNLEYFSSSNLASDDCAMLQTESIVGVIVSTCILQCCDYGMRYIST